MTFDPTSYGPAVAAILGDGARLMPLGPGTPNEAVRAKLAAVELPNACHAGLWLYHDFLDDSHTISQDISTSTGSFWHAVMHRREPDAFNSKYWWRKVGSHPVLKQLVEQAPSVGYDYTTPQDFVDFCERVRGTGTPGEDIAKRVQLLEWQLLFDHGFRAAGG
ncbi:hypothetical protein [Limnoglobus roseus]|uniref:Uncharacterized protein n=1 Tax=Limnoglobus roseus TaxID=2598579 RepID=A0A5C1A9L6_9BACT|nr:hypothetical protein [Limnoglobus roseus]QEL14917.1 hypothetical protein PX52LOC_01818 [Limnoglobus roseus]